MSVYTLVECDVGDCEAVHDFGAVNKSVARRWARENGWVTCVVYGSIRDSDLCPEHRDLAMAAP